MASHKKFKADVAHKILRHVDRQPKTYRNADVDLDRTINNTVIVDRGFNYYKQRLAEVEMHRKKDVVTLVGVIVTLPKELNDMSVSVQDELFKTITEFLTQRYGQKNLVQAIVHRDEAGQPHLHFCFVPTTKNEINPYRKAVTEFLSKNPDANNSEVARAVGCTRKTVRLWRDYVGTTEADEKLCAFEVINRKELLSFHRDLADYLNQEFFYAPCDKVGDLFYTGITKKKGNKTVEELKAETMAIEVEQSQDIEFEW